MDTETEIELEVRIQENIERLLAELEAGKEGTASAVALGCWIQIRRAK